jgi:DNA polymerase-4
MRLPQLPIEVEIQRKPQLARKPLVLLQPCNQRVLIASKALSDIGIIPGESRRSVEQRYPNAFFLTATEDLYQKKHTQLKNILGRFCADIESNSLGEFFISTTMLSRIFKSEDDLSAKVIQQIVAETQLPVTVAIAGNKFTAYCASLQADPTCTIPTGKEADFLASLPLTYLINPPSELLRRLNVFGIRTLGEFAQLPHGSVVRQFGPELARFHDMARGNDNRILKPFTYPPTIILSKTLPDSLSDIQPTQNILQKLTKQLSQRLEQSGYHANTLTLSTTDENEHSQHISASLKPPTSECIQLHRISVNLLRQLTNTSPIVKIELKAYPLHEWHKDTYQIKLFEQHKNIYNNHYLQQAVHSLKQRFGEHAIQFADTIDPPKPKILQVHCDLTGIPTKLQIRKQTYIVEYIYQHWRVQSYWWDKSIKRDYYQVNISDGRMITLFCDHKETWFLDRAIH